MKYEEYDKEVWEKLLKYAEDESDEAFWILYQNYLEKSNLVSNRRRAIHKMVKRINDR